MRRIVVGNVVAMLFVGAPLLAQSGRITGTVTSADDARPLAGVQVRVSGSTVGAISREDGRYTITITPGTYRLRATRIGFAPDSMAGVVVTDGAAVTANFRLAAAATQLSAVQVIGYGTQEARDQTGVVATVTTEDFNTGRVVSPEELIRGKVAGVQVVDNNEPGGGIAIRIRGGTSINAANDPLYVIDGVPLQVGGGASSGRNPLNFLNPNDIASVNILKDASSTAIYGSRAANGVVIITTKTGSSSGPSFTYQGTVSGTRVTGGPDLVTGDQYRSAAQQYAPPSVQAIIGTANTDWLGAIVQEAGGVEHNLGFNGRREDMSYRLGLGYLDQSGVLRGTRTQRASLSLNYDDRLVGDRLTLRAHLKGSRNKDWYTPGGVLGSAVAFAPSQPIRAANGQYFEFTNPLGVNNPLKELELIQDNGATLRSIGNVEAELRVPYISGLTATVRGGYDVVRADRTTFTPTTAQGQVEGSATTRGNFFRNIPEQLGTVLDAYARYDAALGGLSRFDVTGGFSTERFRGDYPYVYSEGLATDLLGPNGVPLANFSRPGYNIDEYRLQSGFGRANLSLADRYLFTATVRRDGSSRFAVDNQYGVFPSAAFAWRMSEEPLLRGRLPVSDLKLRVSWGVNGNQSVGNYIPYTNYTFGQQTAQQQLGQEFVPTIRPSAKNFDLKWERTTSTNVGLDFGMFDNRITASVEGYVKRTNDLLFDVQTAAGTALSNRVVSNLGTVENRGFEFNIDAGLFRGAPRGGFTWDANFNASTNRNEFLSFNRPGITTVSSGGISGGVGTTIQVIQPGLPVNSFFVYEHIREGGKPVFRDRDGDGQISDLDLFVDRNGDNIINTDDLRAHKNPAPRWILGHTSNIGWKGFDASTTLRAYLGSYVYNNVASNFGHYGNLSTTAPATLHSSALENNFTRALYLSDIYVEEASFLRMDNLTVGFTFDRLGAMQRPRIFGTLQNVFTSTGYSGVDPTAGVNGIDNTIYPRSRTFLGGLSVGF